MGPSVPCRAVDGALAGGAYHGNHIPGYVTTGSGRAEIDRHTVLVREGETSRAVRTRPVGGALEVAHPVDALGAKGIEVLEAV